MATAYLLDYFVVFIARKVACAKHLRSAKHFEPLHAQLS
jgi:hypothetical protein